MPVELHIMIVQVAGSSPVMYLLKAVHVAQLVEQGCVLYI